MNKNFFKHSPDFTNSPGFMIFASLLRAENIPVSTGYALAMRGYEETLRYEKGIDPRHFTAIMELFGIPSEQVETITRLAVDSGLFVIQDAGAIAAVEILQCVKEMEQTRQRKREYGKRGGEAKAKNLAEASNNLAEASNTLADSGKTYQTKTKTETKTEINISSCSELFPSETPTEPTAAEIAFSEFSLELNTGETYRVPIADVEEYRQLYPAVDVPQELRNMAGWLKGNPTKRKTRRGIGAFITSWLSRTQDKGGSRTQQQPKQPAARNAVGIPTTRDGYTRPGEMKRRLNG